jgi:hypothetical protein
MHLPDFLFMKWTAKNHQAFVQQIRHIVTNFLNFFPAKTGILKVTNVHT